MLTGMRELPSGTVTFFFTDMAGSTAMLRELGPEAYAEELAEHRRIVREACRARAASRSTSTGDAFFFAFERAADAVAAAQAVQDGLGDGPARVRIGTAHRRAARHATDGYVGMDVHRAARIAAAGHGGQVLVSQVDARARAGGRVRRPRRAAAQGPDAAGADLPARLGTFPAVEEPEPHEPADRGAPARRPGGRAGRAARAAARAAPGHADRPGRVGQDAPRAAGRGGARSARSTTACSSSTLAEFSDAERGRPRGARSCFGLAGAGTARERARRSSCSTTSST